MPDELPPGRCDLHCHLLWGVDDGAKTPEDALQMGRALVELGYSVVAPSPHARATYAPPDLARSRLEETRRAFVEAQIGLALAPNAENFILEEGFFATESGPARRPIGEGPYVLVEVPYQAPLPALREMVFRLTLLRVQPVFAHPERCSEFSRPGRAREVVDAGALLQLDMGALTGRYGQTARKLSHAFLDEGLYAIAATDLHSPERAQEWVGAALKELEKRAGAEGLRRLTEVNPRRILEGLPLAM